MTTSTDQTVFPPFTVTRAAIDQLTALGGAVRIDLEDGGCCGTTYVFDQADPAAPDAADGTVYGCPGAWLIVSDAAADVFPEPLWTTPGASSLHGSDHRQPQH